MRIKSITINLAEQPAQMSANVSAPTVPVDGTALADLFVRQASGFIQRKHEDRDDAFILFREFASGHFHAAEWCADQALAIAKEKTQ